MKKTIDTICEDMKKYQCIFQPEADYSISTQMTTDDYVKKNIRENLKPEVQKHYLDMWEFIKYGTEYKEEPKDAYLRESRQITQSTRKFIKNNNLDDEVMKEFVETAKSRLVKNDLKSIKDALSYSAGIVMKNYGR